MAALAAPAGAQTFNVTVAAETANTPNPGGEAEESYYIDGVEGAELHLTRGVTYTFQMQSVPLMHPFYISTSETGGGVGVVNDGVTGNFATGNDVLTFTPGATTPDLVYYQCGSHTRMGWRLYISDPGPAPLDLEEIASGFVSPVGMSVFPDGSGRFAIVDLLGFIRVVMPDGSVLPTPFLDVTSRMVTLNPNYSERGLLGLAFHPDYTTNGKFYVYYSAPLRAGAPADFNHTSHISEFLVSADPNVADPNSERIVLQVDQPQSNHNGGTIAFGPDDYLYISLGDGGGADDVGVGHVPDWYAVNDGGNGQDVTDNLLGSILRIDVDGPAPYGIPADNPFVGRDGLDEIYAYGFRNPWRFSFDQGGTNDLIVGDAGQDLWEEVSVVTNGGNYGWNVLEGTHCFSTATPEASLATCPDQVGPTHPDATLPLIDPVIEYPHPGIALGHGLVVVAGQVYRGALIPELAGKYIFADWSDSFGAPSGQLFVADPRPDGLWSFKTLPLAGSADGTISRYILAFGQDTAGEVYVLTTDNAGPSGTTGRLFRIVPEGVAVEPQPGEARGRLSPATPNPFAGTTTIRYSLAERADATVTVVDALGRTVATLADGPAAAGPHEAVLDGAGLRAGVYVVRLVVDGAEEATQRVALAR
jgi:glucose/arabinose dehydrogenase